MKPNKARILSLLSALLLSLTACTQDTASIQILEESTAQPEYINFFSYTSMSGQNITKYWIDHFTETYNKQVYINFDSASYYDDEGLSYRELLEKRMESSVPDDLYIINAEDVLAFGEKGYWMDLSDMQFVENLSDAALYQSTYNGKVFSLPLSFTGFGFLWNVDMLEEHGLSVPQNLEEFLDVCEKLKSAGILPYGANKGYGLTVPAMCVGLAGLYQAKDTATQIDALNSGKVLISEYMCKGYAFLDMMIEKGYLDPDQAMSAVPRTDDLSLFFSGGCAFVCTGLGDFYEAPEQSFRTEMTGLPVLADGRIAVYGANDRLCVNPNSQHLETALEFIEMVGTVEALERNAALKGVMSSTKSVDTAQIKTAESLVNLLQEPGQIPNQDFSLHFNTWESIRDVARELCKGSSVSEICELLDAKQAADLAAYGNRN